MFGVHLDLVATQLELKDSLLWQQLKMNARVEELENPDVSNQQHSNQAN